MSAAPSFPGLPAPEAVVLDNWLAAHRGEFSRLEFNVRIGAGVDPGPAFDQVTRSQAIRNTQRRIDAVVWKGGAPTLVEVKVRAGLSAIGQLLGYDALWTAEARSSVAPALAVICNTHSPDIEPVAAKYGISVVDVPADLRGLGPLTH